MRGAVEGSMSFVRCRERAGREILRRLRPALGGANLASTIRAAPDRSTIRENPEMPLQALEGERKRVTALFADIRGSTEVMEDLDPEEARAIVDPALDLIWRLVY